MTWVLFVGFAIIVPPWILFPLLSVQREGKRNRVFELFASEYGLQLQIFKANPLTVLWPDQVIEVRSLSGRLNGKQVQLLDRLDVGWTINLWGLRHFFYLFPLRSGSTVLRIDGVEADLSSYRFGLKSYAGIAAIRSALSLAAGRRES
jgi:hypothetical protein